MDFIEGNKTFFLEGESPILMLFRKIWGWECFGMLEYHGNLWCIIRFSVGFSAIAFFNVLYCCTFIVLYFLMRTGNFNLTHSSNRVHFFNTKWTPSKLFFKILSTIFQRYYFFSITLILRDTYYRQFSVSGWIYLTKLSNFVYLKLNKSLTESDK